MKVEYQSIPDKWKWTVLKYHVDLIVPMRDKPKELDGNIPWIRIEDFNGKYISGSKSGQGVSAQTASEMNLKVFPPDTVLCSCSCSMGVTAIVERELISNQTFIGIFPKKGLSSDFLYYMMNAFSPLLQNESTGSIQQYLSKFDFGNIRFISPPLETQKQIADFLDKETTRIDTLISKKQKQIELLQEKRQAIITEAVTGKKVWNGVAWTEPAGVKDSGVEWIGEIPEHWEVLDCKKGFDIKLGKMIQNEPLSEIDELVPYMKAINVNWLMVDTETDNRMWASPKQIMDFGVRVGDLLVCEGGEVGRSCLVEVIPENCIIQNALHRVRSTKRSTNKFLYYFMNHVSSTGWFDILCNKATIAHFTYEKFGWMKISLPPKEEQIEIVQKLDKEVDKIDEIKNKIQKSIALLKEYRSSLITHAVSGLPVPGAPWQTGRRFQNE